MNHYLPLLFVSTWPYVNADHCGFPGKPLYASLVPSKAEYREKATVTYACLHHYNDTYQVRGVCKIGKWFHTKGRPISVNPILCGKAINEIDSPKQIKAETFYAEGIPEATDDGGAISWARSERVKQLDECLFWENMCLSKGTELKGAGNRPQKWKIYFNQEFDVNLLRFDFNEDLIDWPKSNVHQTPLQFKLEHHKLCRVDRISLQKATKVAQVYVYCEPNAPIITYNASALSDREKYPDQIISTTHVRNYPDSIQIKLTAGTKVAAELKAIVMYRLPKDCGLPPVPVKSVEEKKVFDISKDFFDIQTGFATVYNWSCDSDYENIHNGSIICNNGLWELRGELASCRPRIHCPLDFSIRDSNVTLNHSALYYVEGTAYATERTSRRFGCRWPDFRLYGEAEQKCLSSGNWSDSVPFCKRNDPIAQPVSGIQSLLIWSLLGVNAVVIFICVSVLLVRRRKSKQRKELAKNLDNQLAVDDTLAGNEYDRYSHEYAEIQYSASDTYADTINVDDLYISLVPEYADTLNVDDQYITICPENVYEEVT